MKKSLLAPALVLFLLGPAWAEDPVYFADATLKAAVEAELWASDPTPTDMLGLTFLNAGHKGVTSLTGLEHARNLQVLIVNWSEFNDLSPLAGLTNLEELVLHGNQLSDISALSGLVNLRRLDLRFTSISDLSVLCGLENLKELDVWGNCITDTSSLSCLSSLEVLWLGNNRISDLSPLSQLVNLQELFLPINNIVDVSPLSGLPRLRVLDLSNNKISDVCPLASLTSLKDLDLRVNPLGENACQTCLHQVKQNNPGIGIQHDPCGSRHVLISSTAGGFVTYPGEGEFVYEGGELIKVQAQADPCFVFAGWTGSYPSQSNPVFITLRKDHEIRANFVSVLDVIHVDDDGSSEPAENGTAEHPFHRIQDAIDIARQGVTIVVHAGTYRETIDFLGKSLTLTGFDPDDPNAAGWPVLDGGGAGPAISFTHGEDPNCILAGFVITGGKGRLAGAILCSASSPTITNCLIVGNGVTDAAGGAVYSTDSNAVLVNCTIADNYADQGGAGLSLLDSRVEVVNSILWGNGASEIVSAGVGGASVCYSDVAGGWEGPGCINVDPFFAGVDDYHLQSQVGRWDSKSQTWVQDWATSPCIDAGDPNSPVGDSPLPNGGVINLGAFGGTTEASKSSSDAD